MAVRLIVEEVISPWPDAQTVMHQLSAWINHYNEVHAHKALGYRSPREFIAARGGS
jgi:putative transposase